MIVKNIVKAVTNCTIENKKDTENLFDSEIVDSFHKKWIFCDSRSDKVTVNLAHKCGKMFIEYISQIQPHEDMKSIVTSIRLVIDSNNPENDGEILTSAFYPKKVGHVMKIQILKPKNRPPFIKIWEEGI